MLDQQYLRNGNTHIEFRDGLFIRIPGRPDVNVVRKGFGSPLAAGFQVIRPLVNFFIEDATGNPVIAFKPPMEFLVRFTQHDLDEAAKLRGDLVFAYYDLANNVWVLLPPARPNVTRHIFFEGFDGFGGFRGFDAITLDAWPADPSGAWGV